jgi:hypothetical protein
MSLFVILLVWLIPLAFLAAVAWVWFGRRPNPERFATAQGIVIDEASLPLVRSALHRTYVGRITGALVGAVALGALAWLLGTIVAIAYLVLLGLVAGTMVGIAVAQHRRRPARDTVRHASLTARTVAGYAPEHAAWSITIAGIACFGLPVLVALNAPAGLGPYAGIVGLAAGAVVVVPLGRILQRRVVEAPRGDANPAVDDALRRTAVSAVHHAILGVLCCGIVLAGLTGALVYNTMVVESEGRVVFHAPPGSTSISVDAGRQVVDPDAPARVYWTEADGSDHERDLPQADRSAHTEHHGQGPAGLLLGWLSLLVTAAAITQWSRATRAWKRVERSSHSATSSIEMPSDPAGSPA